VKLALTSLLTTVGLGGAIAVLQSPGETDLGAYSTSLKGRNSNQRHNAIRVLEELNGKVIPPGAEFSFNQTVKGWTRDVGYKLAPVSYNGQLVDSWGGGVCQTSTTLYNAALLAGLEITERNRHRFMPSYVPPGRDAAVAFENIDLRFKNSYPFPIRILGSVQGDRLIIRLSGSGKAQTPLSVTNEVRDVREKSTHLYYGEKNRVRNSGKTGFEVWVYRNWADHRELVSTDDYPAMDAVIEKSR